jgi:hypothetical protein
MEMIYAGRLRVGDCVTDRNSSAHVIKIEQLGMRGLNIHLKTLAGVDKTLRCPTSRPFYRLPETC